MFDKDAFVAGCRQALKTDNPQSAVKTLMEQTLTDPAAVAAALNREDAPMVEFLYRDETLTVANMRTAPGSVSPVHNHSMWAVIGMYAGQEDNHLYRRHDGGIDETHLKSLRPGDIFLMDPTLIHAIENPLPELNGAIHVYGGDLQERPGRSLWDPATLEEVPYQFDKVLEFTKQMMAQRSAEQA